MIRFFSLFFIFLFLRILPLEAGVVRVGLDRLFTADYQHLLKGKSVAVITNHTAVDAEGNSAVELFKTKAKDYGYTLKAFLAPEHGLYGVYYGEDHFNDSIDPISGIPIYSLHGKVRRPTAAMLKNVDLLIYDIQDIGSRSYTYSTTLFYAIEEAAKAKIPVLVLDRPNPLGGIIIDGPMLKEKWRSFVGYLNVPYCHGMTIGELALFFNKEYGVQSNLTIIPMEGWKREMIFQETGLTWIPTSPQIPEADTTFFYPTTGILGELQLVNIGVGYTLPFKVVGAPWIDGAKLARKLNEQQFPGVRFQSFSYRPFFGRFAGQVCQGVLIVITNYKIYLPVTTQYLLIGTLKTLYPKEFTTGINASHHREEMFNKVNGNDIIYQLLKESGYILWKLRALDKKEKENFRSQREAYLLYS